MLEIRNIHKSFSSTPVLGGIDLDVNQGDVIAIIGPSGSGKTTLLRSIDGRWSQYAANPASGTG